MKAQLEEAINANDLDELDLLIKKVSKNNKMILDAFGYALQQGKLNSIEKLLDLVLHNDVANSYPFFLAAQNYHIHVLERLFELIINDKDAFNKIFNSVYADIDNSINLYKKILQNSKSVMDKKSSHMPLKEELNDDEKELLLIILKDPPQENSLDELINQSFISYTEDLISQKQKLKEIFAPNNLKNFRKLIETRVKLREQGFNSLKIEEAIKLFKCARQFMQTCKKFTGPIAAFPTEIVKNILILGAETNLLDYKEQQAVLNQLEYIRQNPSKYNSQSKTEAQTKFLEGLYNELYPGKNNDLTASDNKWKEYFSGGILLASSSLISLETVGILTGSLACALTISNPALITLTVLATIMIASAIALSYIHSSNVQTQGVSL